MAVNTRWIPGAAGLAALFVLAAGAALVQPSARARPHDGSVRAPVVVIGVAGLAWGDIRPHQTPRLWRVLSGGAAAGAATVPAAGQVGCAADGWLSLSAGQLGFGPRLADGGCEPLPPVRAEPGGGARVEGWRRLVDAQSASEFSPRPGRLGAALTGHDGCETAVGPGAAVALAGPDGRVGRYRARFDDAALDCPVTVIDGGQVVEPGTGRLRSLARIDRFAGHVLDRVRQDTTVLVQGVTKPPGGTPELAVALLAGPATRGPAGAARTPAPPPPEPAFLTARSTRWDGVVRLLDVPSTLLQAVGAAEPSDFSGAPIAVGGHRPDDPTTTVHRLGALTATDQALRRSSAPLLWTAVLAQLVLFGGALARAATRAGRRSRAGAVTAAGPGRGWFTGAALVLAGLPAAAYLVTLTRWWLAPLPDVALWAGLVAAAAAVAALAGRLRRVPPWRIPLAVSLLTFAVLVVDAVTGTPLHRGSPFGPSALYGGRYYGFGNSTFAVFSVAALVLAGAVAAELTAAGARRGGPRDGPRDAPRGAPRGQRRARGLAVGAVLAIGAVAVVVDTWPAWGADVGGGLALVPGVAVLALAVAGVRMTLPRLAGAGLAGVVTVAAVALADWSRPPVARTHAGRFVQDVLDGQAGEVVRRKAGYALASLTGGPLAWLTAATLLVTVLVLARPARWSPAVLDAAARRWPTLRPTAAAVVVTAVLGALVNDYGLRLVTYAFVALFPLIALSCAFTAEPRPARPPGRPLEPPGTMERTGRPPGPRIRGGA